MGVHAWTFSFEAGGPSERISRGVLFEKGRCEMGLRQIPARLSVLAMAWCSASVLAEGPREVTYNREIAPILFRNCAPCHRPGEVAPFSLLTYHDTARRSTQIAELTSSREMPPWKAEHGEVSFTEERRLSDDEIALIRRWSESGAAEGDPADLPEVPRFATGWRLGEPDMIVRMPEPYTLAASGPDEYRCFVLPIQIPEGKYITSIEYRPSNRRVVHHAVFTSMPHKMAAARLSEGDGRSFLSGLAPPGQILSGQLSIWTPGMEPSRLPDDLAARWPSHTDLILQLHLHPSGKPEVEQSTLGIHLTDRKPRAGLRIIVLFNSQIDIPPGRAHDEVRASKMLLADTDIYGIFPHMHLIGRTIQAEATRPDATRIPLISIRDWDFNWQNYYRYASPLHLPAGTKIDVRWTYDNSAGNPANPSHPPRRVTYGEQTTDEMAFLVFDAISTGPLTPEELARRSAIAMGLLDSDRDGLLDVHELALAFGRTNPADIRKRIAMYDKDGDFKINAREFVETFKAIGLH